MIMTQQQNAKRKEGLQQKVNRLSTQAAIIATPIVLISAAHAEEAAIDVGTLGLTGLSAAAATVFAIKASPSFMMWGYRKILGFIGR